MSEHQAHVALQTCAHRNMSDCTQNTKRSLRGRWRRPWPPLLLASGVRSAAGKMHHQWSPASEAKECGARDGGTARGGVLCAGGVGGGRLTGRAAAGGAGPRGGAGREGAAEEAMAGGGGWGRGRERGAGRGWRPRG